MSDVKGDFAAEAEAAYPSLVRAATALCRSRSDVEDVVQETFMSAFRSYGSFRGESSFLTWIYTILVRTTHTANQRHSGQLPRDYAASLPQSLPPVDHALVLDENARCLIGALRALPERQREIMTLRFLEELSYAQIAQALELSVGTVKATVFQARASLRTTLAAKGMNRREDHVLP